MNLLMHQESIFTVKKSVWQWRNHSGYGDHFLVVKTQIRQIIFLKWKEDLLQYIVMSGVPKLVQEVKLTLCKSKAHSSSEDSALVVIFPLWQ